MSAEPKASLFLELPAELRIQIYRDIFRGSRVIFNPRRRKDKTKGIRKGQHDVFYTTSQWLILLTCRQCYYEGRCIFWEETRLHGGDLEDMFSADFLPAAVSDFTKSHVRHLRCISHQSLWRVLEGFSGPNVETIEIHFPPQPTVPLSVFCDLNSTNFTQLVLPRILHLRPGTSSLEMWYDWLESRGILIEGRTCAFILQVVLVHGQEAHPPLLPGTDSYTIYAKVRFNDSSGAHIADPFPDVFLQS